MAYLKTSSVALKKNLCLCHSHQIFCCLQLKALWIQCLTWWRKLNDLKHKVCNITTLNKVCPTHIGKQCEYLETKPLFVFKAVLNLCFQKSSIKARELDVMREWRDTESTKQLFPLLKKIWFLRKVAFHGLAEWVAAECSPGDWDESTCWEDLLPIWKLESFFQKTLFSF